MRETDILIVSSMQSTKVPDDSFGTNVSVSFATDTTEWRARGLSPDIVIILDEIGDTLADTIEPMLDDAAVIDRRDE